MTLDQVDGAANETNGSFEDEDDDLDKIDSPYHQQSDKEVPTKAYALYDFNGKNIEKVLNYA